ncbi:MAG: response regulator transcription factor [Anaerolineae bacterium]
MRWFDRILQEMGWVRPARPFVTIPAKLHASLAQMAAREQKSAAQIAEELLQQAVHERQTAVAHLRLWQGLTPREKQTAALACLGCTNHEIADQMIISPNTVKSHIRSILSKFNVNSKAELQAVLAGWDFTPWLAAQNLSADTEPPPTTSASSAGVKA